MARVNHTSFYKLRMTKICDHNEKQRYGFGGNYIKLGFSV